MTPRGNRHANIVIPEILAAMLVEQRKTNELLQMLVAEMAAEGPAEKLGKMLDGCKSKSKR